MNTEGAFRVNMPPSYITNGRKFRKIIHGFMQCLNKLRLPVSRGTKTLRRQGTQQLLNALYTSAGTLTVVGSFSFFFFFFLFIYFESLSNGINYFLYTLELQNFSLSLHSLDRISVVLADGTVTWKGMHSTLKGTINCKTKSIQVGEPFLQGYASAQLARISWIYQRRKSRNLFFFFLTSRPSHTAGA